MACFIGSPFLAVFADGVLACAAVGVNQPLVQDCPASGKARDGKHSQNNDQRVGAQTHDGVQQSRQQQHNARGHSLSFSLIQNIHLLV